jgi:hypothetical protein
MSSLDRHLERDGSRTLGGTDYEADQRRREALSLYRTIFRYTLLFDWPDDSAALWRGALLNSARKGCRCQGGDGPRRF